MCMHRIFLEILPRNWPLKRGTGKGRGRRKIFFFMCTLCTIFEAFKACLCINFSKKKLIYKNSQKPDYSGKHSGLKLGFINDNCSLFFF